MNSNQEVIIKILIERGGKLNKGKHNKSDLN